MTDKQFDTLTNYLTAIVLCLWMLTLSTCAARAESSATITASITNVDWISLDNGTVTTATATPVPADDGSIAFGRE